MRAHKKAKEEERSGAAAKSYRKHIYYDQLMFLEKVANPKETSSNFPPPQEDVPHTAADNECIAIIDPFTQRQDQRLVQICAFREKEKSTILKQG
jgi:hypothetical protein